MKKMQRGGTLVILMVVSVIFAGLFGVAVMSYISAYNYGNSMENQLRAIQDDNRNKLAQYGQKVQEIAQVPSMYAADMEKIVEAAIQGRYGKDGSQATFQWLKEQNPSLDPSLYAKIQQVIEAGRNDFQAGQTRQIDVRRQYETMLGTFWSGTWLRIVGYPKVNLKDFDIVSTNLADEAFKNKKEDGPIKLR